MTGLLLVLSGVLVLTASIEKLSRVRELSGWAFAIAMLGFFGGIGLVTSGMFRF